MVGILAQKRGMTPYRYITSFTRKEFEVDVTGWVSSIFFPVGQILKGVLGTPEDKGSKRVPSQAPTQNHSSPDAEASKRSRRSSRQYSWYRKAHGRSYNVYNLDAADTDEARAAFGKLKKEFASQGK